VFLLLHWLLGALYTKNFWTESILAKNYCTRITNILRQSQFTKYWNENGPHITSHWNCQRNSSQGRKKNSIITKQKETLNRQRANISLINKKWWKKKNDLYSYIFRFPYLFSHMRKVTTNSLPAQNDYIGLNFFNIVFGNILHFYLWKKCFSFSRGFLWWVVWAEDKDTYSIFFSIHRCWLEDNAPLGLFVHSAIGLVVLIKKVPIKRMKTKPTCEINRTK
jgi:hypothetical protein